MASILNVLNENTLTDFVNNRLANNQEEYRKDNPTLPVDDSTPAPSPVNTDTDSGAAIINNAATTSSVGKDNNAVQTPNNGIQAQLINTPQSEAYKTAVNGGVNIPDDISKVNQPANIQAQSNRYAEAPDLSSIVDLINKDVEDRKGEAEKAKKLSWIPILTDLGLLIGDYVGAKGNARVDKREGATAKHNAFTNNLSSLYKESAAKRPERIAQLLMHDFKNRLTLGDRNQQQEIARQNYAINLQKLAQNEAKIAYDAAYKDALIKGKDRDYALKAAETKRKAAYDDAMITLRKQSNNIAGMNASANMMRAQTGAGNLEYKKSTAGSKKQLEFYDPSTKQSLSIPENKWKANYPLILDIASRDPNNKGASEIIKTLMNTGQLNSSIIETYAKNYATQSPQALELLRAIATNDSSSSNQSLDLDEEDPEEEFPVIGDID